MTRASSSPSNWRMRIALLGLASLLLLPLHAQQTHPLNERATVIHSANVYVSPDASSEKVSLVTPGHEVVITDRSGPWVKVFANTDVQERQTEDEPVFATDDAAIPRSGWIRDKGIVGASTPGGDRLLYGAAATAELQASEPHAPKLAAGAAHLLYRRVAEYFPNSPLAAESTWRSADIRWQEEKFDNSTLPSAKDPDNNSRPALYQDALKKIVKQQPGSKYAALAAYDLIDAKLCGDWQGLPKCPAMEAEQYERYAAQFPDGPKSAEALWNAIYRQGVLVTMYTAEESRKKADAAGDRARALNQQMQAKFAATDYAARSASLIYKLEQGIAVYGNDRD